MSSETGSPAFNVIPSGKFTRTSKLLKKRYKGSIAKQDFVNCITGIVESLANNPRLSNSRLEPWPKNVYNPDWEFRKIQFAMPGLSGASGEGRLMYLVNYNQCLLKLVWLYTHEEFEKRPSEKDLQQILRELVELQNDQ